MELIILKTKDYIEIFEGGAKLVVSFKDKPHLKELNEDEIKDLYLAKSL